MLAFFSLEPASSGSSRGGRGGRGDIALRVGGAGAVCGHGTRHDACEGRSGSPPQNPNQPHHICPRVRSTPYRHEPRRPHRALCTCSIVERARVGRSTPYRRPPSTIVSARHAPQPARLPSEDGAPRRPASATTSRASTHSPASTCANPRPASAAAAGWPSTHTAKYPAPGQLIAGPPPPRARGRSPRDNPRVKPAGLRSGAELALSGRKG